MNRHFLSSKYFWIFLAVFLFDWMTAFFPFVAFTILLAGISPKLGMRIAMILVNAYNQTYATKFEILDISRSTEKLNIVKPIIN